MINRGDLGLIQADRDELGQPAVLADHAQRTVPRVHQCDRGLHDAAEHRLELQIAAHRENRLQQAMHPVAGRDHRLQPALKLGQQVIEPQIAAGSDAALEDSTEAGLLRQPRVMR